jgi:hypothetical protein
MSVDIAPRTRTQKRKNAKKADSGQLGLFDAVEAQAVVSPQLSRPPPRKIAPRAANIEPPRKSAAKLARIVAVDDMPNYPAELVAIVDRSIAELPADMVWLTYRDIGKRFGVSRATIARRLKGGLVPGVRIYDGCVLGDGSVRRFDRVQLRWLLLAVRFSGWRG